MNKTALLIFLSAAVALAVFSAMPARADGPSPVLFKDWINDVAVVEDHSEVLARWSARDLRDAVLLHVDVHDDMRPIPDEKIVRLKGLYEAKDMGRLRAVDSLADGGLYNLGNFIYAAARLGIIRKAYWILPVDAVVEKDREDILRRFLKRNRFSDSEISAFNMRDGCLAGTVRSIPLSLCGISGLPDVDGPVVVSLDTDFIPALSAESRTDKLEALQMLQGALRARRYRAADVSVAYSVNGGFLQPEHRWLGDALAAMIRTPDSLPEARGKVPWQAYQEVDSMVSRFLFDKVIEHIGKLPEALREDPVMLLYAADACYMINDIERAFQVASRACLNQRGHCFGLMQLGRYLLREDRLLEAERFFERGRTFNPGMLYFQWELALALKRAGRYEDALLQYHALRPLVGSYPLDLLEGEVHLLMGDRGAAAEHGSRACTGFVHHPVGLSDPIIDDAIRDAVKLYEKEGVGVSCFQAMR